MADFRGMRRPDRPLRRRAIFEVSVSTAASFRVASSAEGGGGAAAGVGVLIFGFRMLVTCYPLLCVAVLAGQLLAQEVQDSLLTYGNAHLGWCYGYIPGAFVWEPRLKGRQDFLTKFRETRHGGSLCKDGGELKRRPEGPLSGHSLRPASCIIRRRSRKSCILLMS